MERQDMHMRKATPLAKRIAVALYRLATSAEERTMVNLLGVSRSSVNIIFREFCGIVVRHLEPRFVQFPRFWYTGWCHIEVCPPKEHATDHFNHQGWCSVILLGVVDHHYKFMYMNVGSPGRIHDATVFERSRLPAVMSGDLFKMQCQVIEGVGPVVVASQAFPLQPHLMKPFSARACWVIVASF
ncbi:hypothetical protein HPB50_007094 [Hyalomma asiaticum]|uniref:Uncharacterized protein n=1 Tax=Hyalomma asiaticum TaxID=266040 RepID=A0ACB7SNV2_HYAAI|nr:hypothetical protein HPB50_007094 [Hyalomma asiaticum]